MFHRENQRFMGLLVLLTVFLLGCGSRDDADTPGEKAEAQEKARNVRVLELERANMEEFFEISGPMAPVQGADLSCQEIGNVVALPVAKGSRVSRGQSLLELDRTILKAEMEAAAMNLETQDYNLDKVQKLHDAGKISRMELLDTKAAQATAKAQAQISRERYDRAVVRAPFAGVIADRYAELGEMVAMGQPVIRLIDPYTLKLEGHLTGSQVAYAKVGSSALVRLGDEGQSAPGKVSWVGLEADRLTGKFKVEVEVDNPDLILRSGVIGRAQISKNTFQEVVLVPRDAVMEGRHGLEVFVIEKGRAHRRAIVVGPDQGALVIVTEGLEAGEQLVVRGHRELVEGALVKVTENATAADGSVTGDPEIVREGSGREGAVQ